jgi:hypothetical protein
MAKHEVVDVLVPLHILLGKTDEEFLLFAHVWFFFSISPFKSAMLCPVQSQCHSPSWMDGIQQALAGRVVEHGFQ